MWYSVQRAHSQPPRPALSQLFVTVQVVWDYHVIAILKAGPSQPESMVYDLDTTVDFPVTLQHYLDATCPVHTTMLQPQFRRYAFPAPRLGLPLIYSTLHHKADGSVWLLHPTLCRGLPPIAPTWRCLVASGMHHHPSTTAS